MAQQTVLDNFRGALFEKIGDLVAEHIVPQIVQYLTIQRQCVVVTGDDLLSPQCLGMPSTKAARGSALPPKTPTAGGKSNKGKVVVAYCDVKCKGGHKEGQICMGPIYTEGNTRCGMHSRGKKNADPTQPVATGYPGRQPPPTAQQWQHPPVPAPAQSPLMYRPYADGFFLIEGDPNLQGVLTRELMPGMNVAQGYIQNLSAPPSSMLPLTDHHRTVLMQRGVQAQTTLPQPGQPQPQPQQQGYPPQPVPFVPQQYQPPPQPQQYQPPPQPPQPQPTPFVPQPQGYPPQPPQQGYPPQPPQQGHGGYPQPTAGFQPRPPFTPAPGPQPVQIPVPYGYQAPPAVNLASWPTTPQTQHQDPDEEGVEDSAE